LKRFQKIETRFFFLEQWTDWKQFDLIPCLNLVTVLCSTDEVFLTFSEVINGG
jgi:hypothetical protein